MLRWRDNPRIMLLLILRPGLCVCVFYWFFLNLFLFLIFLFFFLICFFLNVYFKGFRAAIRAAPRGLGL